jgi:muramidase (phage lysozyme)
MTQTVQFCLKALENKNVQAFFKMLMGTEGVALGDLAFRTRFGGTTRHELLFDNGFVDHPRISMTMPDGRHSDAAGAIKIMSYTFDDYCKRYNLKQVAKEIKEPIFSPKMQLLIGALIISEHNTLQKLMDGHFDECLNSVRPIWASLPGAGYKDQPEHSFAECVILYTNAGGQRLTT